MLDYALGRTYKHRSGFVGGVVVKESFTTYPLDGIKRSAPFRTAEA